MSLHRPRRRPSDSDEEVPVAQLCCLPLAEVQTLDLSTTNSFSVLFEVLTVGDEMKALAAIKRIGKLLRGYPSEEHVQVAIKAGGVDALNRAMKHKSERIRAQVVLEVARLFNARRKNIEKLCKSGYIETLVDLINTDQFIKTKAHAIKTLGNMAEFTRYGFRVFEAGGVTAILSHLCEDSGVYMRTACETLCNLAEISYPLYMPYLVEMAPFFLSHLNTFAGDINFVTRVITALNNTFRHCANDIKLSEEMCIQLIDTPARGEYCQIIETISHILLANSEYSAVFIE